MYLALMVFTVLAVSNGQIADVPPELQQSAKELVIQINGAMQPDYSVQTHKDCRAVEDSQYKKAEEMVLAWQKDHNNVQLTPVGMLVCFANPPKEE